MKFLDGKARRCIDYVVRFSYLAEEHQQSQSNVVPPFIIPGRETLKWGCPPEVAQCAAQHDLPHVNVYPAIILEE